MKNKKLSKLEIITILIIAISIFIYEIFFCNLKDIISNNTYNFSLFRIAMYIIFILLYIKFGNRFIEEAQKTLPSKKKIIYTYIFIAVIYMTYKFTTESHYYVLSLLVLTILNGLLFILYVTKDYIKNIIITILTLGFIFSISTEYYHVVDEKKHFLSSLNVAVGNFNFNEALTNEEFNNIDFDLPAVNFAMKYFSKDTSFEMKKIPENESIFSIPAYYNPITYLPASVGINVARVLGGSIADIFIAGRMANIITYGILLIIIFKLLPFKKDVFYSLYLLPMTFALAGSYSVDGITIGLVGIFIAYTLKLYKENYDSVSLKQFIILIALFILALMCKNGSYLGVVIIIFILPIIKIIKNNKKILSLVLTVLSIAFILGLYQGSKIAVDNDGDVRVKDTSPVKQIEFLLEDPTNILRVYGNYLKESLLNLNWYKGFNLKVFCGNNYSVITFCLFIFILYTSITDSSYTFKNREKIVMFLSFAITFVITTLVLYLAYTEVGKLTIGGYQPRYLIAIMPLILINVNTKKISQDYRNEDNYNKTALGMGIFTILDLISIISI